MTEELHDTIGQGVDFALTNVHTIVIAKITAVNEKTINCVPVINRVVDEASVRLPEFIEVPPVIMQGGGSYIAEPVKAGDYCLVLISERCYDSWYAGSDFVPPLEMRIHDYSDGFALCGVNPLASAISIPKKNRLMMGNTDHSGDMVITGNLTVKGDITCTGRLTAGAATIGGIDFGTHTHRGDSGGNTGGPQ
ncbi:Gp138 family membrane-puncturing spike protein [Pantoea brenneri]|uniref:Gp138 family membrane-puncturing spike protein n=1 Tax=Pantoea brenneri TaxID=472694 RepID=UPI0024491FC6|nr:Gp138 family membrane-puncturing spike protein [Pantoea brenneri]MDH1085291.1 Gp138 family membrane-puncturing spike protein [Pantoea brenneri]